MSSRFTLCLLSCLLSACSQQAAYSQAQVDPQPQPAAATHATPSTPAPTPANPEVPERYESFAQWQAQFRQQALASGIDAQVFDRAFAQLQLDQAVIDADRSQPEFTRPIWEYLDSAVSASRIANGQKALRQQPELTRIYSRYGVEPSVLVAVWGMESAFGHNIGNKEVLRSLATLAYAGRRSSFWQSQLLDALRILQAGDCPDGRLIGSWAGAMGQTQFMPSTFLTHAVDLDGDGRRDLWHSPSDALASAAHYLQAAGWQTGLPWGVAVTLPPGFDYAQADPAIRKTVSQWRQLGVQLHAQLAEQESASLLLPAGRQGPAWLVTRNFSSILRYNNATSYALAIGLLSDALQGKPQTALNWPRSDRPLSRSERLELQERLTAQGFDPGPIDGVFGAQTRRALRAYQQSERLAADAYPSLELLNRLRRP